MQQCTPALFLIVLISLFTLVEFSETGTMDAPCEAHDGQNITHGELYIPGPNMCSFCVCYHGSPMWCQLIFCPGPPWKTCLKWRIGTACCEFDCEVPRPKNAAAATPGALDSLLSLVALLVACLRLQL